MVRGQDGTEGPLFDAALLASVFDDGLASDNVAGMDALGLQLLGAVRKRRSLDGLQVFTALSGLLGDIVAWMSSHKPGKQGKPSADDVGEKHSK